MGRKVNRQLMESRGYLASIVEGSEDAIASIDLKGVVRSWNRGAERMLGYKAGEIVGRHFYMIVPEELRGEVDEKREEALKKGSVRFETQRLRKDGMRIPVDLTISVINDRRGRVIGTSGVMKDISERKRLERELEEARGHLRSIIDTIGEEICVIDRDYNIISFNRAFQERLKFKGEIVGEKCYRVLHGYSYEDFLKFCEDRCAVKKAFETGRSIRSVHEHRQEDGGTIYHESQALPSKNQEGKVYQVVYIIEDVSVRKRLEEELKERAAELEQSNRLLELTLDIMSHDLLNQVAIIKGTTEVLEEPLKQRKEVQMIKKSAERLEDMIENLKAFTKLESKEAQDFRDRNLSGILEMVIKDMHALAGSRQIKIESTIQECTATANPFIRDVYYNLLSNAIKYSPPGGRVVVKLWEDGNVFKLMVKDWGRGIPDEYKEKVFERFERGNKTGIEGSGLGLAIVKRIVELHKGRVWVEDNKPRGSVFYVELPKEV